MGRSATPEGVIVGSCDKNLKLNLIVNDVEFSNNQVKENVANVVAENMLIITKSDSV